MSEWDDDSSKDFFGLFFALRGVVFQQFYSPSRLHHSFRTPHEYSHPGCLWYTQTVSFAKYHSISSISNHHIQSCIFQACIIYDAFICLFSFFGFPHATQQSVVHMRSSAAPYRSPMGLLRMTGCSLAVGIVVLMVWPWGLKIGSPDWTRTKSWNKEPPQTGELFAAQWLSKCFISLCWGISSCRPAQSTVAQVLPFSLSLSLYCLCLCI